MRNLLLLLAAFAGIACASNCVDTQTCPAECPATAGSATFTAIPNTAYTSPLGTSIASVDCLYSIRYDSSTAACPSDHAFHFAPGQCIMAAFKAHGASNSSIMWNDGTHGGGGSGGAAETTFGCLPAPCTNAANATSTPIQLIEKYLDTPNPQGGTGIGIIESEYSLTAVAQGSTNNFPQQVRDAQCEISFIMSGGLGFTPTAPVGYYGPSWGSILSFWKANVPSAVYGTSPTCLATDVRPASVRSVNAWFPGSWMQPNGASTWENNTSAGAFTSAMEGQFNCSSQPTCLSADIAAGANGATPYLQIVSGAASRIATSTQMFQYNVGDTLVKPYWAANAQGNLTYPENAFLALGVRPLMNIYPTCSGTTYTNCSNLGGHESGLGNVGVYTMGDAFNFLLNVGGGVHATSSGSVGTM